MSIEKEYGSVIAADLKKAISLYSKNATPLSEIVANLPKIESIYEPSVISAIHNKITKYNSEDTPLTEATFPLLVACIDGTHIGTTIRITYLCQGFLQEKRKENEKGAAKLLSVVSDRHTALRLFGQYTLHKLPYLLGLKGMYYFQETVYERWDEWRGPLSLALITWSMISSLSSCLEIPYLWTLSLLPTFPLHKVDWV